MGRASGDSKIDEQRPTRDGKTGELLVCSRPMPAARDLPSNARHSLARLAESSDRASPAVFAGRDDEIRLLNAAVRGTQRGETGHTVVI